MTKLRVKEILKEKGITQKKLSEIIGIAEISLSRSINGNPSLETLARIAEALDVPIAALFDDKQPIYGLVLLNGTTYRIDSFNALQGLISACKDFLKSTGDDLDRYGHV